MNHDLTPSILREWRETHNLSQEAMASLLSTSREWIGKLERAERPISAEIFLRFQRLKSDPGISGLKEPESIQAEESAASYGIETLRQEIRHQLEETIRLAGDNRDRLGWIRVQMTAHLSPPIHWEEEDATSNEPGKLSALHEKVTRDVLAENRLRAEEEARQSRNKKIQGGAGR